MTPEELETIVRRVVAEELEAAFARHAPHPPAKTKKPPRPGPDLLTLAEASELVRAPVSTIRFWIWQGKLKAYKPGRAVLVKQAELVALVEAGETVKKRAASRATRTAG